jgi:kynureninase
MRNRGEVVRVATEDGIGIDTERLLAAIDEQTLLVQISHVLFRSAFIMDIPTVVEKAHQAGAYVVADCYQSLGTVPVKLEKWGVDFAVGGSVKWLCGGPGACYLYVRKDLAPTLKPAITGWLAHQEPFAFDNGPIRRTSNSHRFLSGTPNVPTLYACQPGLDIIAEAGIDRIRARSLQMTAGLAERARARGFDITALDEDARRGGTVAVDVPIGAAVAAELNRRDFLVDHRPGAGIRISPHLYNTDDKLDAVMAEIDQILSD